ncbi:hypothetical protein LENED_012772 [Lentinula edodes]|uniref:Uncharacterized protein n=1 Tax=Lentinula edodes TaxID=5353 RepID=A0A1Q3ETD6_LENED|nr:hypothetical protein LENED_012772 [Lentinula edodes]
MAERYAFWSGTGWKIAALKERSAYTAFDKNMRCKMAANPAPARHYPDEVTLEVIALQILLLSTQWLS